jgi:hypothetical protein
MPALVLLLGTHLALPCALSAAPPASPAQAVARPRETDAMLETRAELWSQEARRLKQQAVKFKRAADDARTREKLQRRAHRIDRDAFGAMDGAKRFMIVSGHKTETGDARTGFTAESTPTPPVAAGPPVARPLLEKGFAADLERFAVGGAGVRGADHLDRLAAAAADKAERLECAAEALRGRVDRP